MNKFRKLANCGPVERREFGELEGEIPAEIEK